MKVSVSLPGDDITFLDAYAAAHAVTSRSAVVHRAIHALRVGELQAAYDQAAEEWADGGDGKDWERTTGDGL